MTASYTTRYDPAISQHRVLDPGGWTLCTSLDAERAATIVEGLNACAEEIEGQTATPSGLSGNILVYKTVAAGGANNTAPVPAGSGAPTSGAVTRPYSYERISPDAGDTHFRVSDPADNRIATCYVEENAATVVRALNASVAFKAPGVVTVRQIVDLLESRECWDTFDSPAELDIEKTATLILALFAQPLPMLLFCPDCGAQHVDAPEPENGWTNPPHKSHTCHTCGIVWRPADVPTVGVAEIATKGKADTWKGKADTWDRSIRAEAGMVVALRAALAQQREENAGLKTRIEELTPAEELAHWIGEKLRTMHFYHEADDGRSLRTEIMGWMHVLCANYDSHLRLLPEVDKQTRELLALRADVARLTGERDRADAAVEEREALLSAQRTRIADLRADVARREEARAIQVESLNALLSGANAEVAALRESLRQAHADLASEQDRRVAAQEAITGHWEPTVARLELDVRFEHGQYVSQYERAEQAYAQLADAQQQERDALRTGLRAAEHEIGVHVDAVARATSNLADANLATRIVEREATAREAILREEYRRLERIVASAIEWQDAARDEHGRVVVRSFELALFDALNEYRYPITPSMPEATAGTPVRPLDG